MPYGHSPPLITGTLRNSVSPIDEKTKSIVRNVMAFYITLQFDKVMLMIENVAP
jgi:hypothetical protein